MLRLLSLTLLLWFGIESTQALNPDNRDFGYFSWDNGSPARTASLMNRRPLPRTPMEVNPMVTFQTGFYAFRIHGTTLALPNFGAYAGIDYETELARTPDDSLPAAQLTLTTEVDGVTYISGKSPADDGATVLADFTIMGGGAGCVPFVLKGVPAGYTCHLQRYSETALHWGDDLSQQVHGKDFWQDYLNADGTHDLVYNLYKNDASISTSWRYRVIIPH